MTLYSKIKSMQSWLCQISPLALALTLGVWGNAALATSSQMITLLYEGEDGISGELLEYDGKVFKIASSIGNVTIPAQDLSCVGNACPEKFRLKPTLPKVSLVTLDGQMSMQGNLVDVTDTDYVLATDLGNIEVPISTVNCEGDGCPDVAGQLPATGLVVLTGESIIKGMLVGVDSTSYVLQSKHLGTIRVDRTKFSCEGEVCP